MIRREQVHVLQRGRRHRRATQGHRRKSNLHLMISPQLQLSLMNEAARTPCHRRPGGRTGAAGGPSATRLVGVEQDRARPLL